MEANNTKTLVCIDAANGLVEFADLQQQHSHQWHSSPVSLQLPNGQTFFQLSVLGSQLWALGGWASDWMPSKSVWSRDLSDPSSSEWTARADMNQRRVFFASVTLADTIYVMAGIDENDHPLSSCERYSCQLNQWSAVASMKTGRVHASAAVLNGCIYIAGGVMKEGVVRSVEQYDPQSNEWRQVAPMSTGRAHFALTSYGGRLWAIGGLDVDSNPLNLVESYDPLTDSWREETPLSEGRYNHAAVEFNGQLYIVGGRDQNNGDTNAVDKYVDDDRWIEIGQLQERSRFPKLVVVPSSWAKYFHAF